MKSPSNKPIRKIQAVLVAGAIATVLIWALATFYDITMPLEVAMAVAGGLVSLATFLAGYYNNYREEGCRGAGAFSPNTERALSFDIDSGGGLVIASFPYHHRSVRPIR